MSEDELFKKFDNDAKKRSRWMRFLLALDQLFNVVIWNGSQDETISSHIHRRQVVGKATMLDNIVCKFLKMIESKHCFKSLGE